MNQYAHLSSQKIKSISFLFHCSWYWYEATSFFQLWRLQTLNKKPHLQKFTGEKIMLERLCTSKLVAFTQRATFPLCCACVYYFHPFEPKPCCCCFFCASPDKATCTNTMGKEARLLLSLRLMRRLFMVNWLCYTP